ncbi:Uncharacterised protein [Listeria grayi]|uniref:Uncharacterized protein n=1 Tax=Listeria grayi TaxID=1641 RepID=A0A378MCV4_LISGR|nr:hypothetical protein [Listeria grayi]STY44209.1 Uncharacterised protein [Listeria grayi]
MKYLVLYDSKQEKYLKKPAPGSRLPDLTSELKEAWQFKSREIKKAWRIAYKAAWLDLGKFFVFGK